MVVTVAVAAFGGGGIANASEEPDASAGVALEPAELTLWHNYGIEANATATEALIEAFEAKNPGVTIKAVSQPADQYFDLLLAAAISKTGPVLATQWTGLFDLKYKDYLQPVNDVVPMDEL